MSMPQPRPSYTIDQYLAIERASEERHMFLDGEIYLMAGESLPHGDISVNLIAALATQLKGKPCRALTKDTKVRSGPIPLAGRGSQGFFSYPDILVVCGEPEYHDTLQDVILNPTVIVEVLSPATEAFDRGEKFTRYQTWNPSLADYLLVLQDRPQIEHYSRQEDGGWAYHRHAGLDAEVRVESIQCIVKLADVYDRVTLRDA